MCVKLKFFSLLFISIWSIYIFKLTYSLKLNEIYETLGRVDLCC